MKQLAVILQNFQCPSLESAYMTYGLSAAVPESIDDKLPVVAFLKSTL